MRISNLCKYLSFILLFLFTANISSAQIEFNRQHKFKDGIYLSAMDFRNDSPTIPPEDYTYEEKGSTSVYAYQRHLYDLKMIDSEKNLSKKNMNKIWGICINGVPYINQYLFFKTPKQDNLEDPKIFKNYYSFAQIAMIGHICTITAEGYKTDYLEATLTYNYNATKFKAVKKLINVDDGELLDFNVNNLSECIQSDEELFSEFKKDKKKKKKIDEYIVRYNQRNPINLKN